MTIMANTKYRLACAVTLTMAGFVATPSQAQFVPLGGYAQPAQQTAAVQPAVQPAGTYQPVQQYQQVQQYQPAQPVRQYAAPQYQQPAPGYARPPGQQSYTQVAPANGYRVAMNGNLPVQAEVVAPAMSAPQVMQAPVASAYPAQTAPMQSAPVAQVASSDCGCQTAQPATSWESYVSAPAAGNASGSCATGDCGTNYSSYNAGSYSAGSACDVTYASTGPKRQWFGGLYGLYMTRDNPGKQALAVLIEDTTAIAATYYPTSTDNILFSSDADVDAEWGYELRFGSTFGSDPCGCNQPFAWEVGYWSLEENTSMQQTVITGTIAAANTQRIYGMQNYAGLEYDRDGAAGGTYAYRPLNDYADYQAPIESGSTNDVRVLGVRTRRSFEIDNLELNFWRFGSPVETSLGARSVASPCSTGSCYGDTCGTSACSTGCGTGRPPRRFFINGLAGVRYVKIDETWQNAIQFTTVDGSGDPNAGEPTDYSGFPSDDDNVLFHDIKADNELVGFQLGCSMNWLVGCKWNFFADSNFGVYGNQIDIHQCVYSGGGGTVRFVDDGSVADVRASKSEVAFLGELRAGAGYQVSCNCRLTAAYRVISVSGVALAEEQIANFSNSELASHVDSNDSILIHGLQTGVEFKY